MVVRAYILLDIADGMVEKAIKTLLNKRGVVNVDKIEGPSNIIALIEAGQRQELAELTNQAIGSVENIMENVKLLPVQEEDGNA